MATTQAVRRWIITGAVTAITITGTVFGATLKDDVGVKKVWQLALSLLCLGSVFHIRCTHVIYLILINYSD